MSTRLIVFACIGFFYISVQAVDLGEIIKACVSESGAPNAIVAKVVNFDYSFTDSKGKCYLKCFCVKSHACDGDLKLIAEEMIKLKSHLPANEIKTKLVECNNLSGANECEAVHARYKCLSEKVANFKGIALRLSEVRAVIPTFHNLEDPFDED